MKADILVAGLIDAMLGEPRRLHPVRGMGRVLEWGAERNRTSTASPGLRRFGGVLLVLGGAVAAGVLAEGVDRVMRRSGAGGLTSGLLLSFTFSFRELLAAGRRVENALERGDLDTARAMLGRDLVSRPTHDLSASEVAGAAIQSLAENLNDSVVAPLLYAAVGGAACAYAYRFVNTADAMLGYRTDELVDFGWGSARADDVLGFVPARLSVGLVLGAAPAVGGGIGAGVAALRGCAGSTPSPNGGWPMAAAAGVLGVRLEKREAYVLNPEGRAPSVGDLRRGRRLVAVAGASALVAAALAGR